MPDHVLDSGDSPELEALFDNIAHSASSAAPAPVAASSYDPEGDSPELEALFDNIAHSASSAAPAPVAASSYDPEGDSPELEALFDSVSHSVHVVDTPPAVPAPSFAIEGDSEELQELFDSLAHLPSAEESMVSSGEPVPAQPAVASMSEQDRELTMYSRVGQLTRRLHDAMRELGYDKSLERAASAIPDAKDRLSYVATMTEQAAERVLNATDRAKPLQDAMEKDARALSASWQKLFANQLSVEDFKALAISTQGFLDGVPSKTHATSDQLMEIVMAQDFQDLTGQVIKRVLDMVQLMEQELVSFLMEYSPERFAGDTHNAGLENGPVVNAAVRTDVVTSQQQVDDLLESLGF